MKAADLTQPLKPIYRILYCGHCKHVWQMRGVLKIRGKKVRRTFRCPFCRQLARQDWLTEPTYRAVETLEHREPMFYDAGLIAFNKSLLEKK